MNCQCCSEAHARLHGVSSVLIPGNKLVLCTSCKNGGHEPRYFVVIGAHSGKDVREFVKKVKYCGQELSAQEVIF